MEEQYWEHFAKTGAVTDYLSYKWKCTGIAVQKQRA